VEVDRITKLPLEELATCDHCSRLLLRPQQLA
jgi:predicted  nucleic acid-binding Zn-ribbon protein